jgi:hypothetical protein
MTNLKKIGLSVLFSALASSSAFAYITDPLPSSTYITDSGLNWTWASPWGTVNEGSIFASPSAHDGWRYATVTELQYLYANLVDDFLNGGAPIQSVAYWDLNGSNDHVDTADLTGGFIMSGNNYFDSACLNNVCEVFYVQDGNSVPVPGTLALLGLGVFALGLTRRNKKTI